MRLAEFYKAHNDRSGRLRKSSYSPLIDRTPDKAYSDGIIFIKQEEYDKSAV